MKSPPKRFMFAYAQYAHLQERGISAPFLTRQLTAKPQIAAFLTQASLICRQKNRIHLNVNLTKS